MIDLIQNWDRALFLFINHDCAVRALDVFFITITNTKFWIIPWIGMAVLFLMKEKKKAAIVLLAVVATFAITDPLASQIIKPMVHRLRPCTAEGLVEGGRYLVGVGGRLSFPSNHAMNMFGMATVLALFYRRNAVWFFLFAGMIGYSRVYVGVHYPGDVLA
nr:phosphatase PAP2 family protein [Chitinispirillaceae bacterium]